MENGVRYVPMTEEVTICFHRMIVNREMPKVEPMNPKTLQYIMGHTDISVTLKTYTHINFDM